MQPPPQFNEHMLLDIPNTHHQPLRHPGLRALRNSYQSPFNWAETGEDCLHILTGSKVAASLKKLSVPHSLPAFIHQ